MSTYNKTKFYWLQLKEDFFDDDAIQWLEEQQPKGKEYALFYLKLCLKSLKTNGILIRSVGNFLIPYDNKKLAELTKTDFDTVTIAMELLKKIGLIQLLDNGEIYISQLENLIGSKSIGAFKKEQQRMLKDKGGQLSTECPPKIEIEQEKELEIEQEKELEIEQEKELEIDNNIALPVPTLPSKKDLQIQYEKEFNKLWEYYPNKKGKDQAKNKYILARKQGTTYEEVSQGLKNYLNYIKLENIELKYIKHGSTWFNQKCWNDDYKITNSSTKKNDEQWALLKGVYDGTIKVN